MPVYLLVLLKFLVATIIQPEEFNPLGEKFSPFKVVGIFLTILFTAYTLMTTLNFLSLREFITQFYPEIPEQYEEWKENKEFQRVLSCTGCPCEEDVKLN